MSDFEGPGGLPIWGESGWANWKQTDNGPRLPFATDIYKWNKIVKILDLPCVPSRAVLVETAFPAFLHAFASLVVPDIKEAYRIKDMFRRGGGRGGSLLKEIKGMVDAGKDGKPSITDGKKRAMFKFMELADRLAWYLFIAGVVTDGVYEWITTAYKMGGCIAQDEWWWEGDARGPVWPGDGPNIANGTAWQANAGTVTGPVGGTMHVPAGAEWWAYGTVKLVPWIGQGKANFSVGVVTSEGGVSNDYGQPIATDNGDGTHSITMQFALPPAQRPMDVSLVWYHDHNGVWDGAVAGGSGGMGYKRVIK